ncbi:hypothetical protein BU24DRAFT_465862 [Aaosphaeria arxii CBS 175.79]|uniref:Uncharacterized protein n=1 Tax=Aaosphaeria arxii CBS 175.79 TaxID=1450172 RepID=A0A6A5XGU8_9PLEO|nr:uncharacterized protein BU24DRAFT_465862 [Aaosphaeria arxii CBS 175.79]KAF2012312.1 hypothetical protein BU24DRAFT_465862 [Aaosphaeria arxii CBS 175.79]
MSTNTDETCLKLDLDDGIDSPNGRTVYRHESNSLGLFDLEEMQDRPPGSIDYYKFYCSKEDCSSEQNHRVALDEITNWFEGIHGGHRLDRGRSPTVGGIRRQRRGRKASLALEGTTNQGQSGLQMSSIEPSSLGTETRGEETQHDPILSRLSCDVRKERHPWEYHWGDSSPLDHESGISSSKRPRLRRRLVHTTASPELTRQDHFAVSSNCKRRGLGGRFAQRLHAIRALRAPRSKDRSLDHERDGKPRVSQASPKRDFFSHYMKKIANTTTKRVDRPCNSIVETESQETSHDLPSEPRSDCVVPEIHQISPTTIDQSSVDQGSTLVGKIDGNTRLAPQHSWTLPHDVPFPQVAASGSVDRTFEDNGYDTVSLGSQDEGQDASSESSRANGGNGGSKGNHHVRRSETIGGGDAIDDDNWSEDSVQKFAKRRSTVSREVAMGPEAARKLHWRLNG